MFGLYCASFILTLVLHAPVSLVQAYCWQIGHNPDFTGPPKAEQVDLRTVRISWFGLVNYRHCTDQFLIKYWQKSDPIDYELTDLVSKEVNSIDIKVTPKVEYQFQVVAREDKGIVGGIDYNYSPTIDFKTSAYNPEVKDPPEVVNVGGGGSGLDTSSSSGSQPRETGRSQSELKPSSDPRTVQRRPEDKGSGLEEVNLSIELIAIIVVCSVVFLLIVVGIVYKLACAQKSQDDMEDDDDDDDDDEDDIPEKEKFEA